MEWYFKVSLETHLFFARIMKEHAIFLQAGFACKEKQWIQKAAYFNEQFETLLREAIQISDEHISKEVLDSGELAAEFTISAEECTEKLSGIAIDSNLTKEVLKLKPSCRRNINQNMIRKVNNLNRKAFWLLNELINFKENILREVSRGNLLQSNYPMLVEHTLEETKLYRSIVRNLMDNGRMSRKCQKDTEAFWNKIMMEHALFIRGMLDPSEEELIKTADEFAKKYKCLLEKAKEQDCNRNKLTEELLEETIKYSKFKTAGIKGILDCKISSVILPLLADHVLREAKYYIRILEAVNSMETNVCSVEEEDMN